MDRPLLIFDAGAIGYNSAMFPRCLRILFGLVALLIAGCTPTTHAEFVTPWPTITVNVVSLITPTVYAFSVSTIPVPPTPTPTLPEVTLPSVVTPIATRTPLPATPTPIATVVPTATPLVPCSQRVPLDDLLIYVSRTYALSPDYVPQDLVSLSSAFSADVTLGYPTSVRAIIYQPLVNMVAAMQADGLAPTIISGYRSFDAQNLAWIKWNEQYPEWADRISMRPGHSEHQLGTTVDFGSPELGAIVGDETIEFHTWFDRTREGQWLATNAPDYGFTMSYPPDSANFIEFNYEPWHFRYVGVEMAQALAAEGIPLLEWQRRNFPTPCIADTSP